MTHKIHGLLPPSCEVDEEGTYSFVVLRTMEGIQNAKQPHKHLLVLALDSSLHVPLHHLLYDGTVNELVTQRSLTVPP